MCVYVHTICTHTYTYAFVSTKYTTISGFTNTGEHSVTSSRLIEKYRSKKKVKQSRGRSSKDASPSWNKDAHLHTNENNEPRSRLYSLIRLSRDYGAVPSPFRFRPVSAAFPTDGTLRGWLLASSHSLRGREQEQ